MRLSIFIILSALIISCNNTGNDPEFKPFQVGTWMVTSDTSANWVGQAKSKINTMQSDTTLLSKPGDQGLRIFTDENTPEKAVKLAFVDSTITENNFDLQYGDITYEFPEDSGVNDGGRTTKLNDHRLEIIFTVFYSPHTGSREPDFIFVNVDSVATYQLVIDGFKDTIEEIIN